jgi:tRNA(Ile)-lysidine synthase
MSAWRRETGGAPTLVACSGGADSTALAIALAGGRATITLAHVVHDLRPREEAEADAAFVSDLGERLGVACEVLRIAVRERGGNAESEARRARYGALERAARRRGLHFIATAHQADDQLESVLMGLLRGAGPRGLRGLARRRTLGALRSDEVGAQAIRLVRPMLDCTRADAERFCLESGLPWRLDATNMDRSRLRAGLRHGPLADLRALRPAAAKRAAATADLLRDVVGLLDERVEAVFGDALEWDRDTLRGERAIVVGEGLRCAALRLTGGRWADRLSHRAVAPAVRAIRDTSGEPRVFTLARRVRVDVERGIVRVGFFDEGGLDGKP